MENKEINTKEEFNAHIELMKKDTLEGRTAKLLEAQSAKEYAYDLQTMFCGFITSKAFITDLGESDRGNFAYHFMQLLDYVKNLSKEEI